MAFVAFLPVDEQAIGGASTLSMLNDSFAACLADGASSFWTQVQSAEFAVALDTYLRFARRSYDSCPPEERPHAASVHDAQHQLAQRVLATLCRIVLSDEPDMPTPAERVCSLHKSGVMSVPALMDVCSLFAPQNWEVCADVCKRVWSVCDLSDDMMLVGAHMCHNLSELCDAGEQLHDATGIDAMLSSVLYVTDTFLSLATFIYLLPAAAPPLIAGAGGERSELFSAIARVYNQLLHQFGEMVQGWGVSAAAAERVVERLPWARLFVSRGVHLLLLHGLLVEPLVDRVNGQSSKSMDRSLAGERLVQTIIELQSSDGGDNKRQLVAGLPSSELADAIDAACRNGVVNLDQTQYDYLLAVLNVPARPFPGAAAAAPLAAAAAGAAAGACLDAPEPAQLRSLVSAVKDILPDFGDGFVEACLQLHGWDEERTVHALLNGDLPPVLVDVDRHALQNPLAQPAGRARTDGAGWKGQKGPGAAVPGASAGGMDLGSSWAQMREVQMARYAPSAQAGDKPGKPGKSSKYAGSRASKLFDLSLAEDKDVLISQTIAAARWEEGDPYEDEYDDSFDDLAPSKRDALTDPEMSVNPHAAGQATAIGWPREGKGEGGGRSAGQQFSRSNGQRSKAAPSDPTARPRARPDQASMPSFVPEAGPAQAQSQRSPLQPLSSTGNLARQAPVVAAAQSADCASGPRLQQPAPQPEPVKTPLQPQALRAPLQPQSLRAPLQPQSLRTPLQPQTQRTPSQPQTQRASLQPQTQRAPLQPQTQRTSLQPHAHRTPLNAPPQRAPLQPMTQRAPGVGASTRAPMQVQQLHKPGATGCAVNKDGGVITAADPRAELRRDGDDAWDPSGYTDGMPAGSRSARPHGRHQAEAERRQQDRGRDPRDEWSGGPHHHSPGPMQGRAGQQWDGDGSWDPRGDGGPDAYGPSSRSRPRPRSPRGQQWDGDGSWDPREDGVGRAVGPPRNNAPSSASRRTQQGEGTGGRDPRDDWGYQDNGNAQRSAGPVQGRRGQQWDRDALDARGNHNGGGRDRGPHGAQERRPDNRAPQQRGPDPGAAKPAAPKTKSRTMPTRGTKTKGCWVLDGKIHHSEVAGGTFCVDWIAAQEYLDELRKGSAPEMGLGEGGNVPGCGSVLAAVAQRSRIESSEGRNVARDSRGGAGQSNDDDVYAIDTVSFGYEGDVTDVERHTRSMAAGSVEDVEVRRGRILPRSSAGGSSSAGGGLAGSEQGNKGGSKGAGSRAKNGKQ